MPEVNSSQLIVHSNNKKRKGFSLRRELVNSKHKKGFSLIELLIVISLFGFTATIITVGYSGFSRRQLLSNAANSLKSNIRFAQSQSLAGVKDTNACTINGTNRSSIFRGWFIEANLANNAASSPKNKTYNISSLCVNKVTGSAQALPCVGIVTGTYECKTIYKVVTLPENVEIVNSGSAVNKYILFEPLKSEPTFFSDTTAIVSFYTSASLLADPRNPIFVLTPCCTTGGISFALVEKSDISTTVTVSITAAGGVIVSKP